MSAETDVEKCLQCVFSELGSGYTENVYHKALEVELQNNNISYETEVVMPITYKGKRIAYIRLDFMVGNNIIIELKSVAKLTDLHKLQVQRYLEVCDKQSAILCNFPNNSSCSIEIIRVTRVLNNA